MSPTSPSLVGGTGTISESAPGGGDAVRPGGRRQRRGSIRANTGETDHRDRTITRRIAFGPYTGSKASGYVGNESGSIGTTTTEHGSRETEAVLLGEIRKRDRDVFSMLQTAGVPDDPEPQKADALDRWRAFMEDWRCFRDSLSAVLSEAQIRSMFPVTADGEFRLPRAELA